MKPYYQDAAVTIYHGDCLEAMSSLEDESVDLLWTDPPYERVAKAALDALVGRKGK